MESVGMRLIRPVDSISTRREGYKPFKSTIRQRLDAAALESMAGAFLRNDIEDLRKARNGK